MYLANKESKILAIKITKVEEKTLTGGKEIINVTDDQGIRWTYFKAEGNEKWESYLKEGNEIQTWATVKDNPKNPQYPYRNISPEASSFNNPLIEE